MCYLTSTRPTSRKSSILAEDGRRSVYAGELEVRPPGAPTTDPGQAGGQGVLAWATTRGVTGERVHLMKPPPALWRDGARVRLAETDVRTKITSRERQQMSQVAPPVARPIPRSA